MVCALALGLVPAGSASAQQLVAAFAGAYTVHDLGTPPGVADRLGGMTFKAGTTDRLLIGGAANDATGACKSTTTRVVTGVVSVRDVVKKKTVRVKAGKNYVARAR